ncbi:MAG: ribosomal protein S18-alanine N-acetyltransferase [Ideonella sp.]|nr:ribosomal protein S18-alanine N-acetyltransferase [Ideonella sp.]
MSARPRPHHATLTLRPMSVADLDTVMSIEPRAYPYPWSRGNFTDSLAAGYLAWMLEASTEAPRRAERDTECLGYYVAMLGFEEMHLLNITIKPEARGRGHALSLLNHLAERSREARVHSLWLEVRRSNERARAVYQRWGFAEMGVRRGYYPAAGGQREDAVLMSWRVMEPPGLGAAQPAPRGDQENLGRPGVFLSDESLGHALD